MSTSVTTFDVTLDKTLNVRLERNSDTGKLVLRLTNKRYSDSVVGVLEPATALELARALYRDALVLEAQQALKSDASLLGNTTLN